MLLRVLVTLLGLVSCAFAQEFASDCPADDGFFADAVQCDKYYQCKGGVLTEKLCPDGMVFNDVNPIIENCDFPFQVNCEDRPELQTPKSTDPNCPRLYGYFPDSDPKRCNRFYYCAEGNGNEINCPEGLVFSLKTGTCVFPDQSGRVSCQPEKLLNFTCPKVRDDIAVTHPRYPDPNDCQFFYVCINGNNPRRNGCGFGQVFSEKTTACDRPINVPECKDYYREYFENYFSNLGGGGAAPDIIAAALASGFDVPENIPKRVKIDRSSLEAKRRQAAKAEPAAAEAPKQKVAPAAQPVSRPIPSIPREVASIPRPAAPAREVAEQPAQPPRRRPQRPFRRRPAGGRRPGRRKTTTTTTTTSAPEYAYDYDYYYDEVAKDPPQ